MNRSALAFRFFNVDRVGTAFAFPVKHCIGPSYLADDPEASYIDWEPKIRMLCGSI